VRRGLKDQVADFLEELTQKHDLPPSRICARAGLTSDFPEFLQSRGLIELRQKTGNRKMVLITDKGREFLTHYRVCKELLPS
jgi:predicted transcriptional regulator